MGKNNVIVNGSSTIEMPIDMLAINELDDTLEDNGENLDNYLYPKAHILSKNKNSVGQTKKRKIQYEYDK